MAGFLEMAENPWYQIHIEAFNGNVDNLSGLVREAPSLINAVSADGKTPLMLSSCAGHIKAVKWLLDHDGIMIDYINQDGLTALSYAVSNNQVEVLKFLLSRGANPMLMDRWGRNALLIAIDHGHVNVLSRLLKSMDPSSHYQILNATDRSDHTALMKAVRLGHVDMVAQLLQFGADPMISCNGITPLELAAAANRDVKNKPPMHLSYMASATATIAKSLPIFEEWERSYILYKAQKVVDVTESLANVMMMEEEEQEEQEENLPSINSQAQTLLRMMPQALSSRLAQASMPFPAVVMTVKEKTEGENDVAMLAHQVIRCMNSDTFGALMDLMGMTRSSSSSNNETVEKEGKEEEENDDEEETETEEEW